MDTNGLFKKVVNLVTMASFLLWNLAAAVPEGGSVAQGSAQISQAGAQTTINQTSQNTVINWHGFDTAATESVKFNQPNSSSIALNRINSGQPTNFNGSLSANGQVWLLNPSGVLFGSTSKIDVAGLLVTTHNITDSNFMSGNYIFTLDPASLNSKIINNGLISVLDSGIVALVAPGVENNGIITANLGKVYLSSGATFVLDMYGDELINFGSNAPIDKGSVSNAGQIIANGGKVHMTANYAAGVLDNMISMTGSIQAKTVGTNSKGQIVLYGGNQQAKTVAGVTRVKGKLDTSSTTSGIGGGDIETSGEYVDLADASINPGVGGSWLLDPLTIDIAAQYGNLIQNELQDGVYVTLSTGVSLATGGTGIIFANQAITWNTPAALTLMAYSSIFVTAPITATNGSSAVILHADTGKVGGTVSFSGAGSVNTNGVAIIYYYPTGGNYAVPTNFAPFFPTNQPTAFMTINSFGDLLNVGANPAGNYLLNADIDTANTLNSPVFNNTIFTGIFDGHDYLTGGTHTISNVFITPGVSAYVGAIASFNFGTIENLIVTGNVIDTVAQGVGGIAGYNTGTINLVVFNGTLLGATFGPLTWVGGIVGDNEGGTITGSGSYGVILGGSSVGGIAGLSNNGSITNDYSFMSLAGNNRGGIIGTISGSSLDFEYVYYAGNSSGMDAFIGNGAVTTMILDPFIYLWGSDHCTGCTGNYLISVEGHLALAEPDVNLVSASFWNVVAGFTFSAAPGAWTTMGDTQLPTISQNNSASNLVLLSGSLSTPAVQTVALYGGNNFIGNITSTASGAFGIEYNPDSATYGFYLATTSGGTVNGAILKTVNGNINPVSGLNIINNVVEADGGSGFSNSNFAVALANAPYTVSGTNLTLSSGVGFLTTAITPYTLNGDIIASNTGNQIFNAAVVLGGAGLSTLTGGNITFASTVDATSAGVQGLTVNASTGTVVFDNNVGTTALNALTVTAPTIKINPLAINTFGITTSGAQIYNGNIQLTETTAFFFPISTETLMGSDITTNGTITIPVPVAGGVLALKLNASNNININGNILLRTSPGASHNGGYLSLTAGNKIFINTPLIEVGNAPVSTPATPNGLDLLSPVVLMQDLAINADSEIFFVSTIDANTLGGASLTVSGLGYSLEIFNNIGVTTPLSSVTFLAPAGEFLATEAFLSIHTTGNQIYNPLFHTSTTSFIVDNPLSNPAVGVTFNGGLQYNSCCSVLIQGNAIFNSDVTPNGGSLAGALTVTGTTAFNGARAIDSITQIYQGAVTVNSGSLTTLAGSSVEFDSTVESTGTPAQLLIGGNLILTANTGSIGQSSNVAKLLVSGSSSLGGNITTTGDSEFIGPVILTADTLITDTGTGIKFDSTIDNCSGGGCTSGSGPFSLALNATAGPVQFQGDIGNAVAINNLTVQNATEIDINTLANPTFHVITTGFQNYVGDLVFSVSGVANSVVQYYLNAGGDLTVNNKITAPAALTSGLDVFINAGGDVFLKGNIELDPSGTGPGNVGGYLDVTAESGKNIFLGTFGALGNMQIETANVVTPTSLSTQSFIFRSPILLDQNVDFNIVGSAGVFDGTIDSDYLNHPGSAFSVAFTGTSYFLNINAPIGSLGELQSVFVDSNNFGISVGQLSQDNNLFPGIPNFSVTTVADQTYLTSMFMYVDFAGTVLFKSDTGTVTFTETDGLHALAVSGGCIFACPTTFNGNVVLNGDVVVHGSLTALNGSVTLNNASIFTDASQEYDGTLILNGANNVLTATNINQITASNIYFAPGSIIDANGNNLTLDLAQTGPSNSFRDTAIFDNTMASSIGTLNITADKVSQSAGNVLTATNLITNTNEGMDLSQGTNNFQTFTATNGTGVSGQSEDNISLTNTASTLTILGITQNGNNIFINNDVNINNTGDIFVGGTVTAQVNNTVSLMATGSISQDLSGNINADILSTSSVTGTDLTAAANQVNSFTANNTISGDINFSDNVVTLMLTGITQTGGNVSITNTGDINVFSNINALGEIVNLISATAGIPQSFGAVNADTLNTNTVTGSDVTGTVNNYSASNTTSGSVSYTNNQSVNITSITQSSPFGSLGILAFGNITQTGAISVIGHSGFTTLNGSIDLATNGGSNNFQGSVGLTTLSSGNAQIFNNNNLSLSTSTIAGNLTSVAVTGGDVINILNDITAGGSQTYNSPVIVDPQFSNTLTLTSGTGILFNSTIDDVSSGTNNLVFSGTSGAAIVTVVGDIGGNTPLLTLYADPSVPEFDFNGTLIHTVEWQEFWNNLVLANANVTLQNDNTQSFDSVGIFIETGITGLSTNLEVNSDIYYGYNSGNIINVSLASLLVDAGMTSVITDGTTLTTTGTQIYNGQVLLENNDGFGAITLAGSTITFNDIVSSDPYNSFDSPPGADLVINADVHFKADVGPTSISGGMISGQDGTLNSLAVTGNIINFNNNVSVINTVGTQTYTGNGINPLLTVNADPTFTAGNFVIVIPVLINANTTYNSTAGNIDFQQLITGDGVSSLTLNPVGGSAMFEADVGTLGNQLGSLIINGSSIFDMGSAQNVVTTGNQTYGINAGDTLTMMNDLSMSVTGLSTGQIVYGGLGVFDAPAYTFTLLATTANSANGPTGQGITGTVHVGNLTLGGAGGANLSQNYPVTESFVTNQGGQQARTNTVSPADVVGVVIYCVNGFNCTPAPGPTPTPTPIDNIPPTLVFNPPVVVSCSGAGCSNLEVAIDNLEEAGVVSCGGSGSGEYGCAYGFVEAKDTNGNSRILMPGDVVYAGDQISKNEGSCMCIKSIYSKKKTCMGPGKTKAVYEK
jgi:filamentous hemagglutinin family protein